MSIDPAPARRPLSRRGKFIVAGVIAWLILGLVPLAVLVVNLNSESDVEAALNAKYDAEIVFETYRRRQELTVDGQDSPCRVEGDLGGLDDVRIECTYPHEPPPLRQDG